MSREQRARIVSLDKSRVWHPYTEMGRYRADVEPIVVAEAQGSRIVDADGRSYIDANASWWTSTLGHGHPRLVAALRQQAERLDHTALAGIAHSGAAELAEALCAVAPEGLGHVFFKIVHIRKAGDTRTDQLHACQLRSEAAKIRVDELSLNGHHVAH